MPYRPYPLCYLLTWPPGLISDLSLVGMSVVFWGATPSGDQGLSPLGSEGHRLESRFVKAKATDFTYFGATPNGAGN